MTLPDALQELSDKYSCFVLCKWGTEMEDGSWSCKLYGINDTQKMSIIKCMEDDILTKRQCTGHSISATLSSMTLEYGLEI